MKYVIISAVAISVIFLVALFYIPLGIEPLTEVYFQNHTKLPKYLFLNKDYNFSFTVHNLEYQKMRYYYNISSYNENDTFLNNLDSGNFILENNESKTIGERFMMKSHFDRQRIVVNIRKDLSLETPEFKKKLWWPDPNYPMKIDIHFWIEEVIGPKITIT